MLVYHKKDFPKLVSYNRFVELIPHAIMILTMILLGLSGRQTGKYYIDSTKLPVCHNLRINRLATAELFIMAQDSTFSPVSSRVMQG